MLTTSEIYRFTPQNVETFVSSLKGVYVLYDEKKIPIYYGKSEKIGLNKKISVHFDSLDPTISNAAYFSFEEVRRPAKRLLQLLKLHRTIYKSQPVCNQRIEEQAEAAAKEISGNKILTTAFLR